MSEELIFPATRFKDAGATDAELEQLTGEFERSDLAVKSSMASYFAGISEGDIRDYLTTLREADHFSTTSDETDTEIETEPLVPVPDPVSESGTPSDDGDPEAPDLTEGASFKR